MEYLVRRAEWERGLDPDQHHLLDGLEEHLASESIRLEHREWFGGGRSGSPVARVMYSDRATQLVLKFFASSNRAGRMKLALDLDNAFVKRHLTKLDGGTFGLGNGGARAVFMRVAGGDLKSYQQLLRLRKDDPARIDIYYDTIIRSIIRTWNDGRAKHRPSTVRSVVGGIVGDRRSSVVRWIRANTDPGNREPLSFLVGEPCRWVIRDLLIGRAHGDLNGRNVLIPTEPEVRTDRFELIDYDHYSEDAPLARDPMHLLVALALDDFANFDQDPSARQDLIKVIVDPDRTDVADNVEYFRGISRIIHDACASSLPKKEGLRAHWRQQCLLALVGDALLRVGRKPAADRPEESRRWCYDLAVAAAEKFRNRFADELASSTVPTMTRGGIINRFFQQEALADRLAHGPYGVLSVQGTAGAGKTTLVEAVVETLATEDDGRQRPRLGRRHVTADYRLDVATLIELINGEAARVGRGPGAALVRLEATLTASPEPIVIVVEAAENLLHPNSDRLVDLGLDEAFTMLNAHEGHRVSVVLETTEGAALARAVSWPAEDTVMVPGLSPAEFQDLLRTMDHDNRLSLDRLTADEWGELVRNAKGVPRIGELMYATVRQAYAPLSLILAELPSPESAAAYLIGSLLHNGQGLTGDVIKALGVFGTPVPVGAVQAALPGVLPEKVKQALVNLHRDHLVRHDDDLDLYFLPAGDAAIVLDQMPDEERRSQSYAFAKVLQSFLVPTPHTLADLRYHFAQLRAVLRAEKYPLAQLLISNIDKDLRAWNCTALLLEQRLKVRGLHGNPLLERVNENALGGIYLTIGNLREARIAFGKALDLVGPDTEPRDVAPLHANLGLLHLAMNDIGMAQVNHEYGLAKAIEAGEPIARMGAMTGLADCHRRTGEFAEAIDYATEAFNISGTPEFADHEDAATDGRSRAVALAARLSRWHAELEQMERAQHWLAEIRRVGGNSDAWHRATYLDTLADLLLFERLRNGRVDRVVELAARAVDLALDVQDRTTLRQARTTLCVAHLCAGRPAEAQRAITRAGWHRSPGRNLVVPALTALVTRITAPASAEDLFRDLLEETDKRIADDTASRIVTDSDTGGPGRGDFAARHLQGFARCFLVLAGRVDLTAAVESFRMPGIARPQHASGLNYRMEFMLRRLDETGPRPGTLQPAIDALNDL